MAKASTIGIPIKLLNEAQGHVITLEITTGQVYRGKLLESTYSLPVFVTVHIETLNLE
jgi:small nuclear ribonucleoprotein D3